MRAGKRGLEVEHVGEIRSAPAVDRLVVVADHEQIAMLGRKRLDQPELRVIGVLVLVHQHVLEPPRVPRTDLRTSSEQPHALGDQVVEVEGALAAASWSRY